jgi:Peptidase family S41
VVKEEGRDAVRTVVSATGPALWHAPLTVLVDGDTASAAEILAGVTSFITTRRHKHFVPYHPGSCNRVLVKLQHWHVCLP